MRLKWLPIAWVAVLFCAGSPVRAQDPSAAELLQQFNAVIFGNFSSSADVEGRTLIGGNLDSGATFALNASAEAVSAFSALNVYGSVESGNFNVDSASGVTIGGSNQGSFTLNDGGSVFIGGNNTGNITTNNGSGSVSVVGSNSATLSLNSGGSVYVGAGNSGSISVNNGSGNSIAINGNNSANVTVNGSGTVQVNGNAGNGSLNGGSLTYTGSIGQWNLNNHATATHLSTALNLPAPSNPLPSLVTSIEQPLIALSKQLASLTPTSTVLVNGNSVTLEAHAGANGIAVLDLSTAVFQQNDTVTIALNGAESFIINLTVAGCSSNCSYTMPNSVTFKNPTSYADSVLWNITDVSSLSFTNEFGGTILAPYASVTNQVAIDGDLIAASFSGSGELHDYPFKGPLPTPEPSGLMVMAVGLLGTGAWRWRTRRRGTL